MQSFLAYEWDHLIFNIENKLGIAKLANLGALNCLLSIYLLLESVCIFIFMPGAKTS